MWLIGTRALNRIITVMAPEQPTLDELQRLVIIILYSDSSTATTKLTLFLQN